MESTGKATRRIIAARPDGYEAPQTAAPFSERDHLFMARPPLLGKEGKTLRLKRSLLCGFGQQPRKPWHYCLRAVRDSFLTCP